MSTAKEWLATHEKGADSPHPAHYDLGWNDALRRLAPELEKLVERVYLAGWNDACAIYRGGEPVSPVTGMAPLNAHHVRRAAFTEE